MRTVVRGFAWLLFILVSLALALFLWLRTSVTAIDAEISLAGLNAAVDIVRDQHAVPHIYAENLEDAYFALGYVHAQDRLWQMEFQRRLGAGRLAEVLGAEALSADRFFRTLGIYRAAEATMAALTPEAQQVLLAYAAGVNSYLEQQSFSLPPEFVLLRHRPERWRPEDSLVWLKMMAWDLSGNWSEELLRARLQTMLSPSQIAELWPAYPEDAPLTVTTNAVSASNAANAATSVDIISPDVISLDAGAGAVLEDNHAATLHSTASMAAELADIYSRLPLEQLWAALPQRSGLADGSNAWVIDGQRSSSGAPLLANDPHLSLQAPSLWYLAHLHVPPAAGDNRPQLEVIGATLPGLPLVLLGRNDRIAWGFTNTGSDTQDFFIERLDPDAADRYLTPEGSQAFVRRAEAIRVRGQEDEVLELRESRHGPILSDIVGQAGFSDDYVLALRWTGLLEDDRSFQAGLALNRAGDWDDFVTALRDFHSPQQNIFYADVEGNIGFIAPGRVPLRAAGEGMLPVPGWDDSFAWQGFVPFEELPQLFNPTSGQIANANNAVVDRDFPHLLSNTWAEPYRIRRIEALLAEPPRHSLESFARIQADSHSLMAQEFVPFLLALELEDPALRELQAQFLGWDGNMAESSREALIFSLWYRNLGELLYADELGAMFDEVWNFRPLFMQAALRGETDWCDNLLHIEAVSCQRLMVEALQLSYLQLQQHPPRARWGDVRQTLHRHNALGNTPLGRLFSLRNRQGGDAFSPNVARYPLASGSFDAVHGASFRAIYDLGDLQNSRFIHSTGQSGNPLSGHYRDYLPLWQNQQYLPMHTERSRVEAEAQGTLRLRPAQ